MRLFTIGFVFLLGCANCADSQDFQYTQAHFTPDYIEANNGKWTVEVPEVQELVHILFAVTDRGLADMDLVDHETPYYQRVMAHFMPFKNERIVETLHKQLEGSVFIKGNGAYARMKMDACGFYFLDNKIVKDSIYPQLNWDDKNYLSKYLPALEAFAQKSNFRAFFQQNRPCYDSLIVKTKQQLPIDKQWKWLEERFPNRYNHYRITFSPLVNGSHSTNRFENGGFKQTVMFICAPFENTELSPKIVEGLMTKIAFTEIDHNYVNPITDKYRDEINKIFNNRAKWASGNAAKSYGSPYSVFNEYMTYAVFCLYIFDTFEASDFRQIMVRTEQQMVNNRGFDQFKAFNQQMLALYRSQSPQTIEALYPLILEWCKNQ